MASVVWNQIRLTRSTPPGRAEKEPRRSTYAAALQQFEELMKAARVSGAAARPLPLFYALSQAGRAIAAAHAADDVWELHGHGLTSPSQDCPLMKTTVKPKGLGAFQRVADIVGSANISGAVELGALWCSLPDLAWSALPQPEWPVVAFVWEGPKPGLEILRLDIQATVVLHTTDWSEENIKRLMGCYPTAKGWTHASAQDIGPLIVSTPEGRGVRVSWPGRLLPDDNPRTLDDIAPAHRFEREHWLQPTVGGKGDPVTPIMRWWALLYGLSTLARYEPAKWTRELRLDSSPLAVRLEDGLDEALTAIPHLVLEALVRDRVLLPRHTPPGEP